MRHALIVLALAACTDAPPFAEPDPVVQSHVATIELPPELPQPVDILFVVGDVGGRDLRPLADTFAREYEGWFYGYPDLHVSVATRPDVLAVKRDVYGGATQSFSGSLADALATQLADATQTTDVLSTMTSALGFVQDRSHLGVVIISGTDDRSPDADYAAMLKTTKADPADVYVAGIYPRPAPQLDAFLERFVYRNTYTPLDAADYTPAFDQFRTMQRSSLVGPPCLESDIDLDPSTPGFQLDCDASGWTEDGVELETIPFCDGTSPTTGTCWDLVYDRNNCLFGSGYAMRFRGEWAGWRPRIRWECATK